MGARYFGAAVARIEDPRLINGRGSYIDDISLPGMLHAAFVRSSDAHAMIRAIDRAAAQAVPDVVAVLTADDLGEPGSTSMAQMAPSPPNSAGSHLAAVGRPRGLPCRRSDRDRRSAKPCCRRGRGGPRGGRNGSDRRSHRLAAGARP